MAIQLNTHLKSMVVKAVIMEWSIDQVHTRIDEILDEYEVKIKKPTNQQIKLTTDSIYRIFLGDILL